MDPYGIKISFEDYLSKVWPDREHDRESVQKAFRQEMLAVDEAFFDNPAYTASLFGPGHVTLIAFRRTKEYLRSLVDDAWMGRPFVSSGDVHGGPYTIDLHIEDLFCVARTGETVYRDFMHMLLRTRCFSRRGAIWEGASVRPHTSPQMNVGHAFFFMITVTGRGMFALLFQILEVHVLTDQEQDLAILNYQIRDFHVGSHRPPHMGNPTGNAGVLIKIETFVLSPLLAVLNEFQFEILTGRKFWHQNNTTYNKVVDMWAPDG